MSYLLDSDMLIYFLNRQEPGHDIVSNLIQQNADLRLSTISVMELCAGWTEEQKRAYLPLVYDLFPVIPITADIAERAGQLRHDAKQQGRRAPGPMDALIAATALAGGCPLITNNGKDYAALGMELYRMS